MALITCPQCKKEISSNAEKCPHCGEPKKKTIGCLGTIVVGSLVIFIVGLCNDEPSAPPTPKAHSTSDAFVMCKDFVRKRLKAPASADFPWAEYTGGLVAGTTQEYRIASYVDSQNSFGAQIRSRYVCHVRAEDQPGDNWRLIDLAIIP